MPNKYVDDISQIGIMACHEIVYYLHSLWNTNVQCYVQNDTPIIPVLILIHPVSYNNINLFKIHSKIDLLFIC